MRILEAPAAVRSAALMTHADPAGIAEAVEAAGVAAEQAGCKLTTTFDEVQRHDAVGRGVECLDSLPERPDLCLVLGGDGTLLRALRHYAFTGVPVFGINFGTIGFLAAVERQELDDGLAKAFSGDFDVMELPGLELHAGGEPAVGLNDVSFTRQPHGPVAELSYRVAGQEIGHVRCDGLVAATPAGSTGYNLANQGPVMAWGVEGYAVSFVAAHTLTARPIVIAPDDVLSVRNAGERVAVDIAIDGQPAGTLDVGGEVEIRFRDGVGNLAQLPGSSFYRRIREKFGRLAR